MAGLQEIMRKHLRKGDIVTRFSPAMYAMLLPTVNYTTGSMVMERMEQLFYEEYPSRKVALHYRISPLGTTGIDTKKPIEKIRSNPIFTDFVCCKAYNRNETQSLFIS
jgi:GGDEF domain-containing protein